MQISNQSSQGAFLSKSPIAGNFLRVKQSQNLQQLKPSRILNTILSNQLIFLDFGDQKIIKILGKDDPNDSQQETHTVGKHHIAGLNNLSMDTYKMMQYLSENKVLNEHKMNIDEIVRSRIQRIQNRKKAREQQQSLKKRKSMGYSIDNKTQFNRKGGGQINFPQNPNNLQQYLQTAHSQLVLKKLKEGERQLQKSLSSAGNYKKLQRNQSLDLRINNKQANFKLPVIKKKIRYQLTRA